mmetsp:Transcript_6181/g.5524  ORF Transcript_6181/g.5524 Transcript_6181/m.5524 type:complete len:232 (+) Transcript_6181:42-737(+)
MSNSQAPIPPPKPVKPPKPPRPTSVVTESTNATTSNGSEEIDNNQFKVSDKAMKGLNEILAADSEDESLRKYKETLLGNAIKGDLGDTSDPRKLIITEFRVVFAPEENLPDIIHNLDTTLGLQKLQSEGITLREGAKFKFKVSFKVQHEIIVGIRFINKLTKMLVTDTEELSLGSYPPSSNIHTFEFPKWEYSEAPKGMLFRGEYKAVNIFVDSDSNSHLKIEYKVFIVKK